eukprot:10356614-Alexandrium_andersonii.AAC.1
MHHVSTDRMRRIRSFAKPVVIQKLEVRSTQAQGTCLHVFPCGLPVGSDVLQELSWDDVTGKLVHWTSESTSTTEG